jgi:hypothetical protein
MARVGMKILVKIRNVNMAKTRARAVEKGWQGWIIEAQHESNTLKRITQTSSAQSANTFKTADAGVSLYSCGLTPVCRL